MTEHLRPIDLERVSVGELVAGGEHVSQCPTCAATVQELTREAQAFTQRRPAQTVIDRLRAARPTPWRRWWPVVALPIAAVLALVINREPPPEVRLKGDAFSTLINGEVLLTPGAQLRAGDHLSFVVEAQRPGHVLVLDLEAGKPVAAFVPFGGTHSVPVPSGRTVLADGVTLDDSPAAEWLVSFWCEDAVSLDELTLPEVVTRSPPVVNHPGCRVQTFELTRSQR